MSLKQFLRKKFVDPNQLSLEDLFGETPSADAPTPSTVPDTPIPLGHRRLRLDGLALDYRLLRSKRKTIGFLIDDDGLRVTAPRWVTVAEIEAAIESKQQWIFKKINEQR